MRIIHWFPGFLDGGAITNTIIGLANAQADLGHEVLVVSALNRVKDSRSSSIKEKMKCKLLVWKPFRRIYFKSLPVALPPNSLLKSVKQYSPDIFHMHSGILLEHVIIIFFLNCPTVLTPHGSFHPVQLDNSHNMQFLIKLLNRFFYKKIAAFHAFAPEEKEYISKLFPGSIIYSVHQGISPFINLENSIASNRRKFQKRINKEIKILYVGRLEIASKGIDILLEAFYQVVSKTKHRLKLLLVGPEWKKDFIIIENLIRKFDLTNFIQILGPQKGEKIAALLGEADIYIQTSRNEGQSLSVIEALCAGLPAVLSKRVGVYSYPEISSLPYVKFVNPIVKEVGEGLLEVIDNLDIYKKLSTETCIVSREFFSWNKSAIEHIKNYEKIIQFEQLKWKT